MKIIKIVRYTIVHNVCAPVEKISKKHCIIFWNLAHYEYTGRSAVVIKEDLAVRLLGMRVIGNRIRWNEKCVE